MDIDGLRTPASRHSTTARIRCLAVDTPVPSQFSHEILNANPYAYLDDAPLEERRARAVEMRRTLPESVLEEVGKLDPPRSSRCAKKPGPTCATQTNSPTLFTMIAIPEDTVMPSPDGGRMSISDVGLPCSTACSRAAATVATVGEERFWVACERANTFKAAYPFAVFASELLAIENEVPGHSDAVHSVVQGWMQHGGPTTAAQLASVLHVHAEEVLQSMLRLEAAGTVLRGWYSLTRPADGNSLTTNDHQLATSLEWCERRLLARIHRLTLGRLRKKSSR